MKNLGTIIGAVGFVAAVGFAGTANADPYADEAISLLRVTPGLASNGITILNTSADDGDNGIDATGAPDWPPGTAARVNKITSLGFDENGTVTTDDDSGGNVVLGFSDNVCLDGAGADVKLYDAWQSQSLIGNESAMIEVSNNGGISYTDIGDVAPGGGEAGYELDLNGAISSFNRVRVTALDWAGQTTLAGFDLDAVECLYTLDHADIDKVFVDHIGDTALNDEIDQTSKGGFDAKQFKAFEITITNNTGIDDGLSGLTFIDVVPAEFDLDGLGGEEAESPIPNNGICVDGDCDGVEVLAISDPGCAATGTEGGAKGKGKGNQKLAPEVITITADGLDDGDGCTIKVWVMTDDDHPGNGPNWTPTSCPVTLNEGVKVFDASLNLLLQDDSSLIFDDEAPQADGTGNDGICNES